MKLARFSLNFAFHLTIRLHQLVEYREHHGDCLVPSRYEKNMKLGKWVETQRYEYTKLQRVAYASGTVPAREAVCMETETKPRVTNPRLTEERLRRLESIGFEWKVRNKMKRYYDKQWQDMFERLLKFKQENGHCIVPKRYPADMKLGTWVHTQRIQYRKLATTKNSKDGTGSEGEGASDEIIPKGEEMSYRLTEERRKRLEEVGFVWSAREGDSKPDPQQRISRNSYDDLWDSMFDRLVAFKEKHGVSVTLTTHQASFKSHLTFPVTALFGPQTIPRRSEAWNLGRHTSKSVSVFQLFCQIVG